MKAFWFNTLCEHSFVSFLPPLPSGNTFFPHSCRLFADWLMFGVSVLGCVSSIHHLFVPATLPTLWTWQRQNLYRPLLNLQSGAHHTWSTEQKCFHNITSMVQITRQRRARIQPHVHTPCKILLPRCWTHPFSSHKRIMTVSVLLKSMSEQSFCNGHNRQMQSSWSHLPMCGDSTNSTPSTARNALSTVLALLPERLLSGAVAAHHALGPLHLMPICLLLMAQVTCKASPTAWETQPPVNNNLVWISPLVDHVQVCKDDTSTGSWEVHLHVAL